MAIKPIADLLQDISTYITNKVGKIRKSEHGQIERDIVESLNALLTAEKDARINADSLLAGNMNDLDQLIQDEEIVRYNTDVVLQQNIDQKQDRLDYTPENTANKGKNSGYCELDEGAKVPLQRLPSTLLVYKGVWNAATNTPELSNNDEHKKGWVYTVAFNGTQFGIAWNLGDWLIYNDNGDVEKSDNSDDVVSVNGKQGVISLTTEDISDVENKRYVTDSELQTIQNTSNINTGDETTASILAKIGENGIVSGAYLPEIEDVIDVYSVNSINEFTSLIANNSKERYTIVLNTEILKSYISTDFVFNSNAKEVTIQGLPIRFSYTQLNISGGDNLIVNILAPIRTDGGIGALNLNTNISGLRLNILSITSEGNSLHAVSFKSTTAASYCQIQNCPQRHNTLGDVSYQEEDFGQIEIVNWYSYNLPKDDMAPGNNKYYGTDSSGEKGWWSLSAIPKPTHYIAYSYEQVEAILSTATGSVHITLAGEQTWTNKHPAAGGNYMLSVNPAITHIYFTGMAISLYHGALRLYVENDLTIAFNVHFTYATTPMLFVSQPISEDYIIDVYMLEWRSDIGDVYDPNTEIRSNTTIYVDQGNPTLWGDGTLKKEQNYFNRALSNRVVQGSHSIQGGGKLSEDINLTLVNDSSTPGEDKYYGTDDNGVKGWHALPANGTGDTTCYMLLQACNMSNQIVGSNAHTYIASSKTDNSDSEATTSQYNSYLNGTLRPFFAGESLIISRVDISMAKACVSQTNVGASPTIRVAIYTMDNATRTLLGNIDVPVANPSALGVYSNMGGTTLVKAGIDLPTGLNIPAHTMWGCEIISRSSTNEEVSGFGKIQISLRAEF